MAMLAEKRSKQKWSTDPRNTAWSKDTSRYGYQMLEKMGWQSGKGLGSKLHGGTAHVKVSKKNNSLGLGAEKYHDDNWLAHQEDFNDLLAKLNGIAENGDSASTTASAHETEKKARGSKKRVFYQRFVKSKDLSGYSAEDMACIMGQRSKSAPATPIEQSEDEDSDDSCASCPVTSDPLHCSLSGLMTVNAKESVHDYFAKKMAEMKARRASANSGQTPTPAEEKDIVDMVDIESEKKQKGDREKSGKRKKKNRESEKINNDKSSQFDVDDKTCDKYGISVGDNKKSSKKEKKKNKKGLVEVASSNSECDSVISSKKKKKSKDKKNRASESNGSDGSAATVETKQDSDCDSEEPPMKKKRKDKDRQDEEESDQQETNLITKKKKRKQEEFNNEFENSKQTDSSTKSKKRDKKRKNNSVKDSDSLDDTKETKAKKKKSRK